MQVMQTKNNTKALELHSLQFVHSDSLIGFGDSSATTLLV